MPWKECSVMDERLRFVARLLDGEVCWSYEVGLSTSRQIPRWRGRARDRRRCDGRREEGEVERHAHGPLAELVPLRDRMRAGDLSREELSEPAAHHRHVLHEPGA
jgi:hypothetical protein